MVDLNKFVDDFVEEWNGKQFNVNGRNINFDGRYGNQCMDLWNFFLEELGVPKGWTRNPDAAGVWENTKGSYYQQFDGILPNQKAKKGDVFIYNRKAWGTGYGHIGIVLEDLGDKLKVFEVNGLGDGYELSSAKKDQFGSPARIHTWPKTNLYGYLRYIQEEDFLAKLTEKEQQEVLTKIRQIHLAVSDINITGGKVSLRQAIADLWRKK